MEENNASLLLTPAAKKNCNFVREFPFPIIRNENAAGPSDQEWKYIIGHLQEDCVVVYDDEDIKLLFTKGFFGVGSLSKKVPRVCCSVRKSHDFRNPRKQQQQQPSTSSFVNEASKNPDDEEIEVVNSDDDEDEKSADRRKRDEIEVVLCDSGDSMSDDEVAEIGENGSDSKSVGTEEKEHLILTFEEAYFLSYGLGCLVVRDRGQPMDLLRLWNKFCELSVGQNFPIMYTAYHHLRSKGWVVRSGLKYGTDYVLYKDGPPFYHSTYSVLVKPVKEQNFRDAYTGGKPHFTWSSLSALNRITTNAGKGLLLLYVIKPSALSENKVSTPYCISQYKLEEVLFKRWVPSESREEEELAQLSTC